MNVLLGRRRRDNLCSIVLALFGLVLVPSPTAASGSACAERLDGDTGATTSVCDVDGSAAVEWTQYGWARYVRWSGTGSGNTSLEETAQGAALALELVARAYIEYQHYLMFDDAGRGSAVARGEQRVRIRLDSWFRVDGTVYGGGSLGSGNYWDRELRERGLEIVGPLDPIDGSVTAATDTLAYFEPGQVFQPGIYDIEAFVEIAAVMPEWRYGSGNSIQDNHYGRVLRFLATFLPVTPPPCGEGGPCGIVADIDGNGVIELADLDAWTVDPVDVTDDGIIDAADLYAYVVTLGIAAEDCDEDGLVDAIQIFRETCLDRDGNGRIDGCQDSVGPSSPECQTSSGPRGLTLRVNPSPFNPRTTVSFETIPRQRYVVTIYDVRGRRVTQLADGIGHGVQRAVTWEARDHPSGVYFIRVRSGDQQRTERALLLK